MLIDWFTTVAQVINFLILVLLLRRFLYGPIVRAMSEREAKIAARLEEAEQREKEAAEEADSWRKKNEEIRTMRDELLHEAGLEAEEWRQELIRKARQEMDDTRARWQRGLEQEQEALLQEVRQRTIRQVHAIARRALADLADADLEEHLVDVFVRRLAEEGKEEVAEVLRQAAQPLVVRTAFPSPEEMRKVVRDAILRLAGSEAEVRFETAPELVCGIELKAGDHKVAWSLDDYMGSLEEDLLEALGQAEEGGPAESRSRDGAGSGEASDSAAGDGDESGETDAGPG